MQKASIFIKCRGENLDSEAVRIRINERVDQLIENKRKEYKQPDTGIYITGCTITYGSTFLITSRILENIEILGVEGIIIVYNKII
jgi:hypothetical protein